MSGRRCSSSALLVPAWALASLAAAVCAHAAIDRLGALLGGDAAAYDARAHVAVVPAMLFAVGLVAAAFLKVATAVLARREGRDPVDLLAMRFGAMRPGWPLVAVCCGAFATLTAMEFCEQFAAAGHIEGLADALGGTPALGLAVLLVAVVAITLTGLRTASTLVTAARAVVHIVLERFVWASTPRGCGAPTPRAAQRRHVRGRAALLARSRGLRAPPIAA